MPSLITKTDSTYTNLPIHPGDPEFSHQFAYISQGEATPSTSRPKLNLPHAKVICKWAEATKQFLEDGGDLEGGQTSFTWPSTEGFELSSHEVAAPKHNIKQGPVNSITKFKKAEEVKTKDDDE